EYNRAKNWVCIFNILVKKFFFYKNATSLSPTSNPKSIWNKVIMAIPTLLSDWISAPNARLKVKLKESNTKTNTNTKTAKFLCIIVSKILCKKGGFKIISKQFTCSPELLGLLR